MPRPMTPQEKIRRAHKRLLAASPLLNEAAQIRWLAEGLDVAPSDVKRAIAAKPVGYPKGKPRPPSVLQRDCEALIVRWADIMNDPNLRGHHWLRICLGELQEVVSRAKQRRVREDKSTE